MEPGEGREEWARDAFVISFPGPWVSRTGPIIKDPEEDIVSSFNIDARRTCKKHGNRAQRRLFLCMLGLSLSVSACAVSTDPSAVDTHTNWLELCSRDDQCGDGRCIDYVCTVECDPGAGDCVSLGSGAVCALRDPKGDTFCDLPCDSNRQCEGVGTDLVCTDGA